MTLNSTHIRSCELHHKSADSFDQPIRSFRNRDPLRQESARLLEPRDLCPTRSIVPQTRHPAPNHLSLLIRLNLDFDFELRAPRTRPERHQMDIPRGYFKSGPRRGNTRTDLGPITSRVRSCTIARDSMAVDMDVARPRLDAFDLSMERDRPEASNVRNKPRPLAFVSNTRDRRLECGWDGPFARRQTRVQFVGPALVTGTVVDTRPRRREGCHEARAITFNDVQLRDGTCQLRMRDCAGHIGELDLLCKEHPQAVVGREWRCEPDICGRRNEDEKGDNGNPAVNFVQERCQWEKNEERQQ